MRARAISDDPECPDAPPPPIHFDGRRAPAGAVIPSQRPCLTPSPRRLASPRALLASRSVRRASARAPPVRAAAASPEALQALKDKVLAVEEELKGVTVTFVGDNESANVAVADALAKALGYTPLSTLASSSRSPTRPARRFSPRMAKPLVVAENAVLQQLSTMLRCCVATAGGGRGAAARGDCWDYLFGHFTVWLDDVNAVESAKANPDASPRGRAYAYADAHLVLSSAEVDGEASAVGVATQAMGAIAQMVDGDPQLPGKKGFYVKMGCRGDWPTLQPRVGTERRAVRWTPRRGNPSERDPDGSRRR